MRPDFRVRKLLPLTLVAFGTSILLSSCDLLAALFANDTITVNVYVQESDHNGTTDPASYVIVTLNGDSSETQTGYYLRTVSGGYALYQVPDFTHLRDG